MLLKRFYTGTGNEKFGPAWGYLVRPRVSSLPFGTAASHGNVVGKGKEIYLGLFAVSQRPTSCEKNRGLASTADGPKQKRG